MENVKGILSSRLPIEFDEAGHPRGYGRVFEQIKRDLAKPWAALSDDPNRLALAKLRREFGTKTNGYRLCSFVNAKQDGDTPTEDADFVIQAEHFGVPQRRHRVIILGIRDDLDKNLKTLTPVTSQVTVRKVLASFPKLRSALSADSKTRKTYGVDSPSSWKRAVASEIATTISCREDISLSRALETTIKTLGAANSTGSRFIATRQPLMHGAEQLHAFLADERIGGVIQHESRSHMASDLARYLYLAVSADNPDAEKQQSPTLERWPTSLLPRHANVQHRYGKRTVGGFIDRFRVQSWDRAASTVTAHIHKDGHYFIHPEPQQCRSLTVREAARIQTFPENYFFEGTKTRQFIQVGNAVPPYLALQLASVVAAVLSRK